MTSGGSDGEEGARVSTVAGVSMPCDDEDCEDDVMAASRSIGRSKDVDLGFSLFLASGGERACSWFDSDMSMSTV